MLSATNLKEQTPLQSPLRRGRGSYAYLGRLGGGGGVASFSCPISFNTVQNFQMMGDRASTLCLS
jgi:hypothetical protein